MLHRTGAVVNLTGDQKTLTSAAAPVREFLAALPEQGLVGSSWQGVLSAQNEAITVPTQVCAHYCMPVLWQRLCKQILLPLAAHASEMSVSKMAWMDSRIINKSSQRYSQPGLTLRGSWAHLPAQWEAESFPSTCRS